MMGRVQGIGGGSGGISSNPAMQLGEERPRTRTPTPLACSPGKLRRQGGSGRSRPSDLPQGSRRRLVLQGTASTGAQLSTSEGTVASSSCKNADLWERIRGDRHQTGRRAPNAVKPTTGAD